MWNPAGYAFRRDYLQKIAEQRMGALVFFFPTPDQQPNATVMKIFIVAFGIKAEKEHKPTGEDPPAAVATVMTATEKETLEKKPSGD